VLKYQESNTCRLLIGTHTHSTVDWQNSQKAGFLSGRQVSLESKMQPKKMRGVPPCCGCIGEWGHCALSDKYCSGTACKFCAAGGGYTRWRTLNSPLGNVPHLLIKNRGIHISFFLHLRKGTNHSMPLPSLTVLGGSPKLGHFRLAH
jgi:hypothetical protein